MRYLPGIDLAVEHYRLSSIIERLQTGYIGYDKDGMEIQMNDLRICKVIEAIIVGIPLPCAFIDTMSEDYSWEAITGHTVFHALNRFCVKQDLILSDLGIKTDLNGMTFNDLPDNLRNEFLNYTWQLGVIEDKTHSFQPKADKKKNAFLLKEDIHSLIKEFNG